MSILGIEKSMQEDQEAGKSVFILGYIKYISESTKICYLYWPHTECLAVC